MPNLRDLLAQTLPLQGPFEGETNFSADESVTTSDLKPVVVGDGTVDAKSEPIFLKNPCWSWVHDAAEPATFKNIRCRVRGMGMNYSHAMPVCTSLSLAEASIVSKNTEFVLPLTKDFVLIKKYIEAGSTPPSSFGPWQLEANLDQSLVVAFGYVIEDDSVRPLTLPKAVFLDDRLMPNEDGVLKPTGTTDETTKVLVSKLRVILLFSLTCCKERDDFVPGNLLGFNRIYPHAMVMSSADLDSVKVAIDVTRPALCDHAGPVVPPSPIGAPDEMTAAILPMLFADNNSPLSDLGFLPPSLPRWPEIFDYYDTDPLGVGGIQTFTAVNPGLGQRTGKGLVKALSPGAATYQSRTLLKLGRQGEFDSVHVVPRMSVSKKALVPPALRWNRQHRRQQRGSRGLMAQRRRWLEELGNDLQPRGDGRIESDRRANHRQRSRKLRLLEWKQKK